MSQEKKDKKIKRLISLSTNGAIEEYKREAINGSN